MNLIDLKIFACVARHPSQGAAAQELHLTPSAVSKALRRLEGDLDTVLFDRSAKQLSLNASGRRMLEFARNMLAMAEQARADVGGEQATFSCRVAGPAILLWRHAGQLAGAMADYPAADLHMSSMYEEDALAALSRGEANTALVTAEVLDGRAAYWSPEWQSLPLGAMNLQLLAGLQHPLVLSTPEQAGALQVSSSQVLAHDFVSPTRSLFCGKQRGKRSDGWRDDQLPRKIAYWMDDLQLLLSMLKSGKALAYLPDFALADTELVRLEVVDCGFSCSEEVHLVWNTRTAAQWQLELVAALKDQSSKA
ncbi:LysR family transcriptional regulator [Undibacterium sp.]|uniref:LysR family transcriptional regulator n=1 Tax=Undibacterium sp. TaxID=1914977 RepID=UPI002731CA70|nr:LysR family transcriptional regulator [Undibacterium sp.]MDP1979076.1 LysR family transcriptional regulator [Undibacterium sp.]